MGFFDRFRQRRQGRRLRDEGMEALFVRDLSAAEEKLRRAVELLPGDETALLHLGYCLGGLQRWPDAVAVLEQAVQHASAVNPAPLIALASALLELGRLEEARARLQEALRIDIKHPGAHYALGLILLREGRLDEATEEFEEVIGEKPTYVQARLLALAERQVLAERNLLHPEDPGKDPPDGHA